MSEAVRQKRSTIYDIANETNLSAATVSRIINQKGSYSQRSAKMVMAAARRLGYTSGNDIPVYDTMRADKTICVYIPFEPGRFESNSYSSLFMIGATEEALSNGYDLLISQRINEETDSYIPIFDTTRYSALVIPYIYEFMEQQEITEMINRGLPIFYTEQQLPGDIYGNNIYGEHIHCRREALDLLYDLNYRNIVVFELFRQSRNLNRTEAFRDILERFRIEKGLSKDECRMVIYEKSVEDHFQILLKSILESPNRPDVIFTESVDQAALAYKIIQNAGLHIPRDIGIISASHSAIFGKELLPMLTTICVDATEMGKRSIRLLISRLQGGGDEIDREVAYKIHMRDSLRGKK